MGVVVDNGLEAFLQCHQASIFKCGASRFCRLGGVAYRDGAFKSSPRTAVDFGSQHSAMFVAYRGWAACWATA
ncbi:hypothetical protein E3N88_33481 [Mikania micrantha]|uniref:Uncharacterized protein n=1 Tax=Mikania micrantha TaxID=192012 RepID=A0A5N6MBM3_9ASTR|nr:hypothetical protein E3N88_33481 [Mikania micrantha]